jgi:HEAT repeat protein
MRHAIACALMFVFCAGCSTRQPGTPQMPPPIQNEEPAPVGPEPLSEPPLPAAQELARRLTTGDILDRQDAAFALATLGKDAEEAVPALTAALDSVSLREPATQALLAVGPRGWHALLSRSNEEWVRERVRRAAQPNGEAFREFAEAVGERSEALVPLPRLELYKLQLKAYPVFTEPLPVRPSPLTLPFLIRALRDPDDYAVRMLAAERLEQLGPLARPAIDALIEVLEDPWPLQAPQAPPQFGGYAGISVYHGPNHSVRIAAVKALLAIGPPGEEALVRDGIPRLVAGLQTDNLDVRWHTALALARMGPRALPAAPHLVRQLRTSYGKAFSEALSAIGPEVVPMLAPLLEDSNEEVRSVALGVISDLGPGAQADSNRVRIVLRTSKRSTRAFAAGVLARIAPDDPTTVEALQDAVKYDACWAAIEALGRLGPRARLAVPVLEALLGTENEQDHRIAHALQEIGMSRAEVAKKLAAAYRRCPIPDWIKNYGQDDAAGRFLLELLKTERSPFPRLDYARQLCEIGPDFAKRAMPVLMEFLDIPIERRADHRTNAPRLFEYSLQTLRQAGPVAADAIPVLVRHLDGPRPWEIAETLRDLGPIAHGAIPFLRSRARQEKALPWAAPLLARLAPTDPEVVPALMALLAYPDPSSRQRAAEELGRIGPAARQAVPRLERVLSDEAARVRMFASAALIRITGDQGPHAQRLRAAVRDTPSAAWAIATLGDDWPWTITALRAALGHPAPRLNRDEIGYSYQPGQPVASIVQLAAARALAEIGPSARSAMPDLIRILHEQSRRLPSLRDDDLVGACAKALGVLAPEAPTALPVLYYFALGEGYWGAVGAQDAIARIEGRQH